jgi:hypothetical protein
MRLGYLFCHRASTPSYDSCRVRCHEPHHCSEDFAHDLSTSLTSWQAVGPWRSKWETTSTQGRKESALPSLECPAAPVALSVGARPTAAQAKTRATIGDQSGYPSGGLQNRLLQPRALAPEATARDCAPASAPVAMVGTGGAVSSDQGQQQTWKGMKLSAPNSQDMGKRGIRQGKMATIQRFLARL